MSKGVGAALMAAICMTSGATQAQDAGGDRGGPPKWSVGAIGLANRSPFELENTSADGGEKINYRAFPYIAYRGERFFIEGLELGYHLIRPERDSDLSLSLDIIGAARPIAGSSRNKITADAGLRLGIAGSFGAIQLSGLQDVTDTHNGTELSATYSYSFEGDSWSLTPSVGVTWQSEKLANHMWGVTQAQQDKLVEKGKPALPVYQVTESAVNYSAGLMWTYRFADSWSVIAFGNATWLDKAIRANPGINEKFDATIGLGLAYSF